MARTALKVMEKSTFDAAILDLHMPDMTGIRGSGTAQTSVARHRSGHDDGLCQQGNRGTGDAAGRFRLHQQALQAFRN